METTVILGDFQSPYHDPSAVEVALQIAESVKPTCLILNGDFADFHTCGRWPVVPSAQVLDDFSEELERARTLLKAIRRRISVRDCRFNSGNHEWRVERLFMRDSQLVRILGEKRIADATSMRTLLELEQLRIKFTGQYPTGTWLKDLTAVPAERNCYVEHGYQTRKHSGYTASALLGDRMTNCVTGHVERLALVWKKAIGNRRFFSCRGREPQPHCRTRQGRQDLRWGSFLRTRVLKSPTRTHDHLLRPGQLFPLRCADPLRQGGVEWTSFSGMTIRQGITSGLTCLVHALGWCIHGIAVRIGNWGIRMAFYRR